MNRYGLAAQEHWQRHLSSRYAALEDPVGFFTDLGEQIQTRVLAVATQLEASLPTGMPYLERVGQLRAVQKQAEDAAMVDLVFSTPGEPTSPVAELEELLGQLPGPAMVSEQLQLLTEQAEWEAESQGYSTSSWTAEQEARAAQLTRLGALVDVPADLTTWTEQQVTDRIADLQEFVAQS